jgi:hypothetical protein
LRRFVEQAECGLDAQCAGGAARTSARRTQEDAREKDAWGAYCTGGTRESGEPRLPAEAAMQPHHDGTDTAFNDC